MLKQAKPIPNASGSPTTATLRPAPMTYLEFLERDGEDAHVEWVNGEVVEMAPVSNEHSAEQVFLIQVLGLFVAASGAGGEIRGEPFQMKTGPNLPGRSPDVLYVAKRNLSRLKKTHLAGPADLVIEILSTSTQSIDRGEKYYEYEKGGVREYWLIDPLRKKAEFYTLGRDGMFHLSPAADDGTYHSAVMKGLWIKLAWLWQRPLPTILDVQAAWKE